MPIDVYESTRFERLWDRFRATVSSPQSTPLATERIVVPGRGWETWFSQRLAAEFGCWAQFSFQPLGSWVGETLEQTLGPNLAPRREPDALTWDIAALLPGLCREPQFAAIRGYLTSAGDSNAGQLIDLSRCIAGLFDRYLLYRPDLIVAWENDRIWPEPVAEIPAHAEWQRLLWLQIKKQRGFRSLSAMVDDLKQQLADGKSDTAKLDKRVSVWLSGGIAPVHIAFLEAIGRHSRVSVYVLAPASEFWGDMRGRRQLLKQLRDSSASLGEFCREHHLEVMHPLLASLGELSRQQQMMMVDCDADPWRFPEVDGPPLEDAPTGGRGSRRADQTLLHELQSDIRRAAEPPSRPLPVDNSVRIHSCHSPLREVEVLHTQIRDALEADATLAPEDIAVFCPDIATYAPLVRAVFGVTEFGRPGHIPFQIAGKGLHRPRPVPDAYFRLLDILTGRFGVSAVLDVLNLEAVGASAGLKRNDVSRLSEWLDAAGVRWGLDSHHRDAEQLPATSLNTWQNGLDRLLLGYAMPPGSECLVGDVLTLDRAEGLDAVLPGRLWLFLSRMRSWRDRMCDARPISQWREPLAAFARQMLDESVDEPGFERLAGAVDELVSAAASSGFDQPVSLPVIARELARKVDELSGAFGVRVGGVAFCGLDDLRSLPFKVIGLLGMNDGTFPRADRPVRFDLMTESPRIGDGTSRGEDRHLFLEALLAARSQVLITFQGQNDRDQKLRPASVVVEELLDTIERSGPADAGLRDAVLVRHPLQSFSPRYFDGNDPRLFAFGRAAFSTATQLQGQPATRPVFATPVSDGTEPLVEVHAHDLRRLVEKPWTLFLDRLSVFVEEPSEGTDDHEPLLLDALEEWSIGNRWLEARLSGQSSEELTQWLMRTGQLPGGALGKRVLSELQRQGEDILRNAAEAGIASVDDQLHVDVNCDGVRIVGELSGWTGQTIRRVTFSKIRSKRIPALWLDTLIATVARSQPCGAPAMLVGRSDQAGAEITIDPPSVAVARDHLRQLIRLLRAARKVPLPLFPDSLAVVTDALRRDRNRLSGRALDDELLRKARDAFEGNLHHAGAAHKPDVRTAFAGLNPFALTCRDVPELAPFGEANLFACLAGMIAPALIEATPV